MDTFYAYTHNNTAIISFSLTQGLKQILLGQIADIVSTKRFEQAIPAKSGTLSSTNFHLLIEQFFGNILTVN